MTMQRCIIRPDGSQELLTDPLTLQVAQKRLNAPAGLRTVRLRHLGQPAMVMLIDDYAPSKLGPVVNVRATALYQANCCQTTDYKVMGCVLIAPEADYPEEDPK